MSRMSGSCYDSEHKSAILRGPPKIPGHFRSWQCPAPVNPYPPWSAHGQRQPAIIVIVEHYFEDEVNPTDEELRRWAYSDAQEPYEDFDIVIAGPEHLAVLTDLVGDSSCPKRKYLLGSLYCLVGHSDLTDPRVVTGVQRMAGSSEACLRAWAMRASSVIQDPTSRKRDDWCGWRGMRTQPVEEGHT